MHSMSTDAASTAPEVAEETILSRGLVSLRELLPHGWKIGPSTAQPGAEADPRADTLITLQDPGGGGKRLIVEAKRAFAPRDVETVFGGQLRLLRQLDPAASVVVFAPWLSARTRAQLEERDVGYLDFTGNVRLQFDRPAVLIHTTGAERDPSPAHRKGVSVRGAAAGRVVRLLADVRPPYTASAIAHVGGVSVPYVSRLLTMLDREALIQRGRQGLVVDVDWPDLLRRRAETYQLYGTNPAQGYLSGTGAREVAQRLRDDPSLPYHAVTGSFAAAQRAPIAAPSQLAVYVDDPTVTAEAMDLLPTDQGADVVLLTPYDFVVHDRCELIDGLKVVAPSQLALDCLTGNGRMPAEGEALLEWMAEDETQWRSSSIEGMKPRAEVFP